MRISQCKHCGKSIMMMPHVGWAETNSSEQGGNYDLCQKNPPDFSHEPLTHPKPRV